MDSFDIVWRRSAERDIRNIDRRYIKRIKEKIEKLSDEPHPRRSVKLIFSTDHYRIRVGDYRIIYNVNEKESVITICYIRHRKDAYRDL